MGKRTRAILFVLLNIGVSVGVTLTVLFLWERAHPRPEVTLPSSQAGISNDPAGSVQELDIEPEILFTNEDIAINIRTIVGAGDLSVEYAEIINQGQNPADLTEWQLVDDSGQQFSFPALILNSGGAIKVLSKSGTNTVIELYWQSDTPIWQPGETARLLNAAGEIITSYKIP